MRNLIVIFSVLFSIQVLAAGVEQIRFDGINLLSSGSMGASVNSSALDLDQVLGFSCEAVWTGTPTGTIKLQISDDLVSSCSNVSNWIDYTNSSTATGGGAGTYLWNVAQASYRCVRVAYVRSSSTGSLTVNCGRKK